MTAGCFRSIPAGIDMEPDDPSIQVLVKKLEVGGLYSLLISLEM